MKLVNIHGMGDLIMGIYAMNKTKGKNTIYVFSEHHKAVAEKLGIDCEVIKIKPYWLIFLIFNKLIFLGPKPKILDRLRVPMPFWSFQDSAFAYSKEHKINSILNSIESSKKFDYEIKDSNLLNLPKNKNILIFPGCDERKFFKRMNASFWNNTAKSLIEENNKVSFVGTQTELNCIDDIFNKEEIISFNQVFNLINNCDICLCICTGPSHLASFLNKEVHIIFNSTNPRITGAIYGDNSYIYELSDLFPDDLYGLYISGKISRNSVAKKTLAINNKFKDFEQVISLGKRVKNISKMK